VAIRCQKYQFKNPADTRFSGNCAAVAASAIEAVVRTATEKSGNSANRKNYD
jgi:hypothetical protein